MVKGYFGLHHPNLNYYFSKKNLLKKFEYFEEIECGSHDTHKLAEHRGM